MVAVGLGREATLTIRSNSAALSSADSRQRPEYGFEIPGNSATNRSNMRYGREILPRSSPSLMSRSARRHNSCIRACFVQPRKLIDLVREVFHQSLNSYLPSVLCRCCLCKWVVVHSMPTRCSSQNQPRKGEINYQRDKIGQGECDWSRGNFQVEL